MKTGILWDLDGTLLDTLEDLADALHNVPILFADGCKNLKKAVKIEFHYYNKKYKTDLWKELAG